MRTLLPGLLVALLCSLLATAVTSSFASISPLIIALLLGITVAHTLSSPAQQTLLDGFQFSRTRLLRVGIILYGLNVSVQQIHQVGMSGIALAMAMVIVTLIIGFWLGHRVLGMDKQTSLLIACGSAICGAAAVAAVEPVIKAPAHKIAIAVATVVIFGSLSMLIYPLLQLWLGLSESQYGLWVGASIHEVAQVVVAGASVSEQAQNIAVTEKMLRVMLLAPVLFVFMVASRRQNTTSESTPLHFPWFALGFIAMIGVNSLQIIPASFHHLLLATDTLLLSMAMFALGTITHISVLRKAGPKALTLGLVLLVQLLITGFALSSLASMATA